MEIASDPFAACDADWNPSRYGWLSPRISFSQDFVMLERVSPEKRKRDEGAEEKYSSEFEFCMPNATLDLVSGVQLLSADELFLNGQLLPLQLLPRIRSEDALPLPSRDKMVEQPWSIARHLSFENSRSSSMSLEIDRTNIRRSCISLENSRCSSPSRSVSLPPTTPPSPKASWHSSRIKDFFKIGKLHARPVERSREHIASSNNRRPISARSFWPFSRSNSAGESKTTAPPPVLPLRSNSAGESKTTSSCLLPLKNSTEEEKKKSTTACASEKLAKAGRNMIHISCASNEKMSEPSCSLESSLEESSCDVRAFISEAPSHPILQSGVSSSILTDAQTIDLSGEDGTSPQAIEGMELVKYTMQDNASRPSDHSDIEFGDEKEVPASTARLTAARVKGSGSPGRIQRRSVVSPIRNFGKGSPGRIGIGNNPARGGAVAGRLVLRNLERCSANSKARIRSQDMRTSERQAPYSANVRLNVPTCVGPSLRLGKASKNRLLNLRVFFSRKEKTSEVSSTAFPINNWRTGG